MSSGTMKLIMQIYCFACTTPAGAGSGHPAQVLARQFCYLRRRGFLRGGRLVQSPPLKGPFSSYSFWTSKKNRPPEGAGSEIRNNLTVIGAIMLRRPYFFCSYKRNRGKKIRIGEALRLCSRKDMRPPLCTPPAPRACHCSTG